MFDVVSSSKWPTGYLINPDAEPLDLDRFDAILRR